MSKIILIGDLHLRKEKMFYEAQKFLINWLHNQEWNKEENTFIQLGDFFHLAKPEPEVIALGIRLCEGLKTKKVVLAGNLAHEYSRRDHSWAISPLKEIGVNIIIEPKDLEIGNVTFSMLPWFYDGLIKENVSMKDYYENLEINKNADFVLGHFSDEDLFGEKGINLKTKAKKILGHIHIKQGNFIGVPIVTRLDEKGQEGRIYIIDSITKEIEEVKVPRFFDYETINYGDKIEKTEGVRFYIVEEAPSKEAVYEKYPNKFIHSIKLKISKTIKKEEDNYYISEEVSLGGMFKEFTEQYEMTEFQKDRIEKAIKEKEIA